MLDTDEVRQALRDAIKRAEVCSRLCRSDIEVSGNAYSVYHNGIGSDTDHQQIYQQSRLNLTIAGLTSVLTDWLVALHCKRIKLNLNQDGMG